MALLDHFHPPLSIRRHWHAFHNAWATYIAGNLNSYLPEGYFAEPNVQFGIEIDVAAFEEPAEVLQSLPSSMASKSGWVPPLPVQTVPFSFSAETVEVTIFGTEAGPTLIGAIELVSPANKDRSKHRKAFVSKCETYLRQGINIIIVDIVTTRKTNLHIELLERLGIKQIASKEKELYTTAYRPVERQGKLALDIWEERLAIGQPLPTMPLWLGKTLSLPVDLEETYLHTCREQRILAVNS